jgi:sec-independent protein translocase protein TatB
MALSLGSNLRPVVSRGSPGYIWRMAFGIGFQELVIIAVLFLVIFGPSKLPQMARDIGRFVTEARRSVDEFKSELVLDDDEDEDRRPKRKR